MKSQFWFLADEKGKWIFHKQSTYFFWFLAQSCREHHHLSVVGISFHENFLNLSSHVSLDEHFIALVKNEKSKIIELHVTLIDQLENSTWCTDYNVGFFFAFKNCNILFDWNTAKKDVGSDMRHVFSKTNYFFFDLICELSDITQNKSGIWFWVIFHLLENWNKENGCLAHSWYSLTQDISSMDGLRNAFLLNFRWMLKTTVLNCFIQFAFQKHILEIGAIDTCVLSHLLLWGIFLLFIIHIDVVNWADVLKAAWIVVE